MSFNNNSPFGNLPEVVKNLLILNIIGFVAANVLQTRGINLNDLLGLHIPGGSKFQPYQFITYLFMHGSLMHIFFNMFALVSFGSIIERYFGAKRFFIFYFTCGIGAGLLYLLTSYWEIQPKLALYGEQLLDMPVAVGASGAIYGLLMAFGMLFPNAMVGAFLIIPMRAKYAVLLFGLIELYSGINQSQSDNIAHFAHLGGMIFGFILIKIWKIPRAM